ncbi:phage integrase N-terminal SAM-like domain-containing protein [Sorangium sp. So ce861]|uniref:phage integrase N-terminal SAM-like domain-containing protein n=1 Tax=Sorangium sp. So ce861 TaxID=3133323 RepID=UPI003F63A862
MKLLLDAPPPAPPRTRPRGEPDRRYSPRTEEAYCAWIRRFIVFHDRRHQR